MAGLNPSAVTGIEPEYMFNLLSDAVVLKAVLMLYALRVLQTLLIVNAIIYKSPCVSIFIVTDVC